MRATASLALGVLSSVGLLLAIGWIGWSTTGRVPWGWEVATAFALLFLVRLRAQWQPEPAVAGKDAPGPVEGLGRSRWWTSRPFRLLWAFARQCSFRFEFIVFALLAAAVLYQVLAPPVVGLADNGDFGWLMAQTGLEYAPSSSGGSFDFVALHFLVSQPYSSAGEYVSSEFVFVKTALLLDGLVSADGFFDLRVLGALHAAAFLAVLLLVFRATRSLPGASRLLSAGLVLLVFTDVGYVAYFNSLYREPATLIFLTLTIACAFHFIRAAKPHPAFLLAYFAAATLFVATKPQYAPQGPVLAVFGLLLSRRWWDQLSYEHPRMGPWWRGRRAAVPASAIVALMVCLIGAWSYVWQPAQPREAALYNLVFSDVLVHSPTPEADLDELGLDPGLIRWVGTDAFAEDAPIGDPSFEREFFGRVTPLNLAEFYATRPGRTIELLDRAARQGLSLRPDYLGNFEEASGFSAGTQSHAFDLWSNLRGSFPSVSLAGFSVVFGLAVWAGLVVRRRGATLQGRLLAELFILLVAMAAVEFLVAALGGGAPDIVRHLFAFNLLLDIGTIMAVCYVAEWWKDIVK